MLPLSNANSTKTNLATFAITLILTILIAIFLLFPKYGTYKAAKDAMSNAQSSLDSTLDKQKTIDGLIEKMKSDSEELQRVDYAIPDKPDISTVYALIETQAKAAALSLGATQAVDLTDQIDTSTIVGVGNGTSMTPGAKTQQNKLPSATLGAIDVNFTVTGSLEGYVSMLQGIQRSLRLFDIQSIDLTSDSEKKVITFKTTLRTYYQK
ncbi:MAG: hypothetical protein G01um101477_93 [Candidatus Doudnabacteria bacterium Gr01-1014_77]|uniref:Type IV pilus assembly protein PilO n=1 Tax=Candidatus Doudnabacteria bacterium Gr01-1014_77 TaxID=2017133 RepID=A0A554JDH6_9BACT|nr:MAG: hypothetical protein G01um101477_93 [Candidatus Doudnabacteria bacterium Gr01-1014_77]